MNKQLQIAILLAGSTLVSGCQLFQTNTGRLQAGLRIPEQVDPKTYAQEQLEMGRAALAQGNFAAAVAAFRNAALEPAFAAPAHNGLGIAYAGMGRTDIAERFFRLAIAEDPAAIRFQDNLVRLQRAQFAAEQQRLARAKPAPVLAHPAERTLPGTPLRATLAVSTPTGRITSVAGGGFRIGSPAPLPPPRQPLSRSAAGDALPVVASYQPAASTTALAAPTSPDAARPAATKPEAAPAETAPPAATPVAKPATIIVPQSETGRAAATIQTTGRRIPQAEFASIFAPYSGARQPVVAAVSSPGLRSSALPEPTFGRPPTPQPVADMALSGE